jgi:uncharacterized membrane protein
MTTFNYKPKKLFYFIIGTILLSLFFGPIAFGIVFGLWFFYALINWANKINEENGG